MVKIFATLILIFSILLFPPAALAFISQDAVPGDRLYPLKRKLEEGLVRVVSVNPMTRAWFSTALTKRRFDESTKLIASGDKAKASGSLKELITQTSTAVTQVNNVQDEGSRKALAQELLQAIDEFDQGLEEAKKEVQKKEPAPTPQPTVEPEAPEEKVEEPSSAPTLSPSPTPRGRRPSPTSTPTQRPTPTPRVTPTPTPSPAVQPPGSDLSGEIDETQKELERERERIRALLAGLAALETPNEEEELEDPTEDELNPEAWDAIFSRLFGGINDHGQGSGRGDD